MAKFDPNRPYATIHGADDGRHYEQDGKMFDAQGNEIKPTSEKSKYVEDVRAAAEIIAAGKK